MVIRLHVAVSAWRALNRYATIGDASLADQKEICVRRHERVAPEIIRSAAKYGGPWPDARDNVTRPDPLQICWRAADLQPPGGLARSQALRGTDE